MDLGSFLAVLDKHRRHRSVTSSLTTLCLARPWALRIGSDMTQLNRDLVLGVQAA